MPHIDILLNNQNGELSEVIAKQNALADSLKAVYASYSQGDISDEEFVSFARSFSKHGGVFVSELSNIRREYLEFEDILSKHHNIAGEKAFIKDGASVIPDLDINNFLEYFKKIGIQANEAGGAVEQASNAFKDAGGTGSFGNLSGEIKDVLTANQNLEIQAKNTGEAIANEGVAAETAAAKFKELAEMKEAATGANKTLAETAEKTSDALKKEADTKKSSKSTKRDKQDDDTDVSYSASQMHQFAVEIEKAANELDGVQSAYKVFENNKGGLVITKTFKDVNGAAGVLKATINSIEDVIDPVTLEVKNLGEALESAFASATFSYSGTDVSKFQTQAQKAFDKFKIFNSDNIHFGEIEKGLNKLEGKIEKVFDQNSLWKFTKELGKLEDRLARYADADLKVEGIRSKAKKELDNFVRQNSGSENYSKVEGSVEKIYNYIEKIKTEAGYIKFVKWFDGVSAKLKELDKATKDTESYSKQAQKILDNFKFKNRDNKFINNDSIVADLKEVETFIKTVSNTSGIRELEIKLDNILKKARELNNVDNFNDKALKKISDFERDNSSNPYFEKIKADLDELRIKAQSVGDKNGLDTITTALKRLKVTMDDNKFGNMFEGESRTFKDINEVRANIDSLFASMGKVNEKSIRITGTDKLTAEVKAANGEIRKMTVSLDSKGFARFVDNGIVEFGRLRKAAEGVFKGIKDMVRIYLSPQDFIRYFRQGFDKVKEIDIAMTELKKVSDASAGQLAAYFDEATASAKELGSTVKDMIGATADWSRMGYNLPDSKELGEVAVLYKNVGDGISVEEANSSLVSTLQGFQMNANEAIKIVDSFNEVSNNFAINSGGIGEALKRSAAAFNAANTDLNKSIALITAGNEIVQSPEKVGTMWQTVSARIRGTKTELEELGEDTENVLSSSKLRSLVMGYTDVDIMKSATEYKDIYEIVSEIGKKWKDLKDVERANNYCPGVQKCA